MADVVGFTPETAQRLLDLVNEPGGFVSSRAGQRRQPSTVDVHYVQITSTEMEDGRYPGARYTYSAITDEWTEQDEVWVVTTNDEEPVVGVNYPAYRNAAVDGWPVWTITPTGGSGITSINGDETAAQVLAAGKSYTGQDVRVCRPQPWHANIIYAFDDAVESAGTYYRSLSADNQGNAVTDTEWWTQVTLDDDGVWAVVVPDAGLTRNNPGSAGEYRRGVVTSGGQVIEGQKCFNAGILQITGVEVGYIPPDGTWGDGDAITGANIAIVASVNPYTYFSDIAASFPWGILCCNGVSLFMGRKASGPTFVFAGGETSPGIGDDTPDIGINCNPDGTTRRTVYGYYGSDITGNKYAAGLMYSVGAGPLAVSAGGTGSSGGVQGGTF